MAQVNGVLNRFYVLPPGTPKERVMFSQSFHGSYERRGVCRGRTKKGSSTLTQLTRWKSIHQVKLLFKLEPLLVSKLRDILK